MHGIDPNFLSPRSRSPFSGWIPLFVIPLLLAADCSPSVPAGVVPATAQTVTAEADKGFETQDIVVVNASSVPITVTSLTLRFCRNIRNPCVRVPYQLLVAPHTRQRIATVGPANARAAFSYGYSWTWSADSAAPQADSSAWQVGLHSFGPVAYGMTLAELSAALGGPVTFDSRDAWVRGGNCGFIAPGGLPRGAALMVRNGRIERVDVDTASIATESGARVGSTDADILRLYPGRIRAERHSYGASEVDELVYTGASAPDSGFAIIFEIDGHRVVKFRAGRRPAVDDPQGCE